MFTQCLLETYGYQVFFELKSLENNTNLVDLAIQFILNPRLRELSVKSEPSFIAIKDLRRLVSYLEQHIDSLKQNSNSISNTFLENGLGFQIQAFEGSVYSESEGDFTLQFMVNVGQPRKRCSRIYVGGESEITFENIKRFTSSINVALTELYP